MLTCFISHAWANGGHHFAMRLKGALEKRGLGVWIDEEQICPGEKIAKRIKEGIESESDIILIVLSPPAEESKWCLEELKLAIDQSNRYSKLIIPIFLENCPIPNGLEGVNYANFKDELLFEESADRLVKKIKEIFNRWLSRPDPEMRIRASKMLGKLGDNSQIPNLSEHLSPSKEVDPRVRHFAALAIGQIGGETAIKELIEYIGERDIYVRLGVITALENQGLSVLDRMIVYTHSDNPIIKKSARSVISNLAKKHPKA